MQPPVSGTVGAAPRPLTGCRPSAGINLVQLHLGLLHPNPLKVLWCGGRGGITPCVPAAPTKLASTLRLHLEEPPADLEHEVRIWVHFHR